MKISKIFICCLISQSLLVAAYGQDVKGNLAVNEADYLLISFKKNTQDSAKFNLLLRLAQYHILKPGESTADLDTASVYITQAKKLNKRILNDESQSYLLPVQSMFFKEHARITVKSQINPKKNRKNFYIT